MRGPANTIVACLRALPILLLTVLTARGQSELPPLEIRNGTIIPKLLWKDNTFKQDLVVIQVTDTHTFLRDDSQVLAIRHAHLVSLYESTHQNLVSSKINSTANQLGGAKPGAARKQHISPGHIFPSLLWTDGREKRLVEVLNIKSGYYVLRIEGKTAAISQEEFLSVLESTQKFLAGGGILPQQPPVPAEPENPFTVTKVQPPEFGAAPPPGISLVLSGEDTDGTAPTTPPTPPPKLQLAPSQKPSANALGPPPTPPATRPTSARPIQFDFTFAGDTEPPTLPK